MNARLCGIALGTALLLALALPAQAQPRLQPATPPPSEAAPAGQLLRGVTIEVLIEAMKEAGYGDIEIFTANDGSRSVMAKIDSVPMWVSHMHCGEDKKVCRALGFTVNFGKQDAISDSYINAWNTRKLYARLYRDSEDRLLLQQDVIVFDIAPSHIKHVAQIFAFLLRDLLKFNPDSK